MSKEYFTENISDETIADMIDKALKYEKTKKNEKIPRANIIKAISAAAAVVLVIGIINLLPNMLKNPNGEVGNDNGGNGTENSINSATANTTSETTELTAISTIQNVSATETNITADGRLIFQVNVNPKSKSYWKGMTMDNGDGNKYYSESNGFDTFNNDNISYNINRKAFSADGIEIHFPNGTIIKTHDTVKIDANNKNIGAVKIAGDTIIDLNGSITAEGSGKFTVITQDGAETKINGGNQSAYTGEGDPDNEAIAAYEKSGLNGIVDLLPYMSQDVIDEIARKEYERVGSIDKLSDIILYAMSNGLQSELITNEYGKNGLNSISDDKLASMDKNAIDELAKSEYEKNGFKNISDSVITFMSENVLDDLARQEYDKNGLKNLSDRILVFMSENAVDEIALKEYEKNGLESIVKIGQFTSKTFRIELAAKEPDKKINTGSIGRTINLDDGSNIQSIIEAGFMGGIKYVNIDPQKSIKIGKDGEFADISAMNFGTDDGEVTVTVNDGDKSAVITRDKDGTVSVNVKKDGKTETSVLNPETKTDITVELNGKTVVISQSFKGGDAKITITESYAKAKITVSNRANVSVSDYLEDNVIKLY